MVTLPHTTQHVYAFVKAALALLILTLSQIAFAQNVGIGTLTPEDKLHLIGNLRVSGGKIFFVNTGQSVFVGDSAGLADDLSDNKNVFIGHRAGKLSVTGTNNVALGYHALNSSIAGDSNVAVGSLSGAFATGNSNTFLGYASGLNNLTGAANIFLGAFAGFNETGSNKLYISNSDDNSPLLYGEFDQNRLTINDTLLTERFYITEGAADGYLLKSNASGKAIWTNPSTLFNNVWSISGNDIYKNNSGNVGIGTSTPSEKLEVVGNIEVNGRISFAGTFENTYIGGLSGITNTTGNDNTAVGSFAMSSITEGVRNVGVGRNALLLTTSGSNNVAMGYQALEKITTSNGNVGLGYKALRLNTNADNVAVGTLAGQVSTGTRNVFIGLSAGEFNTGSNNVCLGWLAGRNSTESDRLFIDNSATATPLLFGEFDKNKLTINDSLVSKYFQLTDGAVDGYLLKSNASGIATWANPTSLFNNVWSISGNNIYKNNSGNVGIGTSTPTEKLEVVGNIKVNAGRISFVNTGESVIIGQEAGLNDDLSDNRNIFLGYQAGKINTTGSYNVAIGPNALDGAATASNNIAIGQDALGGSNLTGSGNIGIGQSALLTNTNGSENIAIGFTALDAVTSGIGNTAIGSYAFTTNINGSNNVAVGRFAGANNTGSSNTFLGVYAGGLSVGSSNVFIGSYAGENETGNNKLYIDNSNTATPLLYGEFDNNRLTVNDELSTKRVYLTEGAANGYLLKSDAAGKGSWVDPTTLFNNVWSILGDDIYKNNTGNVGIGTATPSEKLDVEGNIEINSGRLSIINPNENILVGQFTGQSITSGNRNHAFGKSALSNTTTGHHNIALGFEAMQFNTEGNNNIAIGIAALRDAADATYNIAIGTNAGRYSTGISNTFIGYNSGVDNSTGAENSVLGAWALHWNQTGNRNVAFGLGSLYGNETGNNNVGLGYGALSLNVQGSNNTAVGYLSLWDSHGNNNTALGFESGKNNTTGIGNTFLGLSAGINNNGSNNVFIGNEAGSNEAGSEKLYIANTNTANPLIYGEFDNNKVVINGSLTSNTFQMVSGATDGYVLQSNSSGDATWVNPATLSSSVWGISGNDIYKSNTGNVGIGTTNPLALLHLDGNFRVDTGKIAMHNSGRSVYIGEDAGINDDLSTERHNTQIGFKAGFSHTLGINNTSLGSGALFWGTSPSNNVAIGKQSLFSNNGDGNVAVGTSSGLFATGSNNTFLGYSAGYSNTGSGNVFIGKEVGYSASGSDKLYIDNSSTNTPLIYGEFNNNEIGINTSNPSSTLEIGGSFGMTFKNSQVAGTNHPDASAVIWRYDSGTGNIDLPLVSNCKNRVYKILNQTGGTRTITTFTNTSNVATTTIPDGGVLTLVSDGVGWFEIK